MGVRWFAPGVTKIPKIKELTVPNVKSLIRPAFLYRQTSYTVPGGDEAFWTRLGQNAGEGDRNSKYGMKYAFLGTCHSYFNFVSPEEFFDTHPEYFSEINGIRRREETQLCLTNPDVLEIVTQRMLKAMSEHPNVKQFNFSQMDYYNYCQCPKCQEINKKYGTAGGTQFWFVNELAKRTSKVYPDKLISTLAYMYTEEPPKGLQMHPNVAIWLCHMYPSCDSHPVAICPLNAEYKRRAIEWSKICSHLYIWHYIINFAHYYVPFPNFRALSADLKFYRDIGVEGIYLQGMSERSGGGEFSLLRPYYVMKLAWDPGQDPDMIIKDFLQEYYGPSWKPIWEYITLLHDKVEKEQIHMHLYTNPAQGYLTDDIIRRAEELFKLAEELAKGDGELLERVHVTRMPITYAKIFPRDGYEIKGGRLNFLGILASIDEVIDFVERMKRHGFIKLREWDLLSSSEELLLLYSMFSSGLEVITISNEFLSVDVVPALSGRVLRIVEISSGECLTSYNNKKALTFPLSGGLEERIGRPLDLRSLIAKFDVIERKSNMLSLRMHTDKLILQRTIELIPQAPILRIMSILTNVSGKQFSTCLRSHVELDLGDLRETRVKFRTVSGESVDEDMTDVISGLREGKSYLLDGMPDGQWTFVGNKGLQVTQSFDRDKVDFVQLVAYPEDLNELEVELWGKNVSLDQSETISFETNFEVKRADVHK